MALTKDYYRILNVKASATPVEIKDAYRKLAMKYHPDRNPDDALAAAIFTDAAEAYKVLADVDARNQYNYQRYLIAEQEYKRPVETMETLINRISKINEQLLASDPFRFNKDALLYSIKQVFPDDINLVVNTNEISLKQLLEKISFAAKYLSSHQTKQVIALLQPFFNKHVWLKQRLHALLQQQQRDERWEKNKIILAVVVAIILCVLIFFAAGK